MSKLSPNSVSDTKKSLSLESKMQYFDNSKYLNFVSSSKLEGIAITKVDQNLKQLIAKYQTMGDIQNGR